MPVKVQCPICGSASFSPQGRRPSARCAKCGSLERGRLAWLLLDKMGYLKTGTKFLNIAPESFMLRQGIDRLGKENYVGLDFEPSQYNGYDYQVGKLDLCGDLNELRGQTFDVIMHNHVLEHLMCSVPNVLRRLNDILRAGGIHLFSIPIYPGKDTVEDLDLVLTPEERVRRFGQEDHMRIFGGTDFQKIADEAGIKEFLDLSELLKPSDLEECGIPLSAFDISPHHIFIYKKV